MRETPRPRLVVAGGISQDHRRDEVVVDVTSDNLGSGGDSDQRRETDHLEITRLIETHKQGVGAGHGSDGDRLSHRVGETVGGTREREDLVVNELTQDGAEEHSDSHRGCEVDSRSSNGDLRLGTVQVRAGDRSDRADSGGLCNVVSESGMRAHGVVSIKREKVETKKEIHERVHEKYILCRPFKTMPINLSTAFHSGAYRTEPITKHVVWDQATRDRLQAIEDARWRSNTHAMPEVTQFPQNPAAEADSTGLDMETVKKYAPYALGAMALLFVLTR